MRTCEATMCDFQFQSIGFGSLFLEVKRDPEIALFLISTAYGAFVSSRAKDLTEPFPPFLLKKREIRPDAGNLDHIAAAQTSGKDVKNAAQVNSDNKDCELGVELLKVIYSVL